MTRFVMLVVNPGMQITPQVLPVVIQGQPYETTLTVFGAQPPVNIWISAGTLPAGLTFVDNGDGTATISGTTDDDGDYDITVQFIDVRQEPRWHTYRLRIAAVPVPLMITGTLAAMTVGTPYSDTLTISGGQAPYTLGSFTLPAGVTASLLVDIITVSGTPTGAGLGAGYSKSFGVTISATDDNSAPVSFSQTVGITVPTLVATGTAPAGDVGTPYSYAFGSAGGVAGSKTYSYTGTLPGGLTLSSSGVLSGTPTTATGSPFGFSVFATDGEGNVSAALPQSVAIVAAPVYAVWNLRHPDITLSNANRTAATVVSGWKSARGTEPKTSGKWQFEAVMTVDGNYTFIGVLDASPSMASGFYLGQGTGTAIGSAGYWGNPGQCYCNTGAGNVGGLPGYAPGSIITVALDLDAATPTVSWYVNGVFAIARDLPAGRAWSPGCSVQVNTAMTINSGQVALTHPVSGYNPGWYA